MGIYGTKREDLLSGVVNALSGGRVSKVRMSGQVSTGSISYDTKTGKAREIVMPREENLPKGCSVAAAQGLLHHEVSHARYTTVTPGAAPLSPLLHDIVNRLEDPRVEHLMVADFPGVKDDIAALSNLGFRVISESFANEEHGTLDAAMMALSLRAYRQDELAALGSHPKKAEVLAFLDHAEPYVQAALKAQDTNGVIVQARAILALLKDSSAHQPPPPPPPPAPQPKPQDSQEQNQEPCEGEGEGESQSGQESGEDDSHEAKDSKGKDAPKDEAKPESEDKGEKDESEGAGAPAGEDETETPESQEQGSQGSDGAEDEDETEGPEPQGSNADGADAADGEDENQAPQGQDSNGAEGEDEVEGPESQGQGKPEGDEGSEQQGDDPAEAQEPASHDGTDSQGGTPEPSTLSQEALLVDESGTYEPLTCSPADAVMELLREAIEAEIQRIEKEKQADLLKARKSGLLCPLSKDPSTWMKHEREEVAEETASMREAYPGVVDALRPVIMGVRHALRIPLMAMGRARTRTGRDIGDLDPAAMVHVAMGTSDRVFQLTQRGKTTKTAVFFLIDRSGSMSGSKIKAAQQAAVAFSEALSGLPGVSTEIGGFYFDYTGFCVHTLVKSFRDRLATRVLGLGTGDGNADGSAIRWAARRLLNFHADRRILIVLSDGRPADGPNPAQDLRDAVEAAERHGIETMGIGIMDDSVEAFYPKHVVIQRVADLSGEVLRALTGLFTPEGIAKAKARVNALQIA
jgi:cobalamin biosynthesis protein CobT